MDIAPIKSHRDYRRVLKEIEGLMSARRNSPEGDRLDVLVTLVEAWERKHSPLDLPDPVEAIRYHMEQSGLQPRDLIPFIGSRNRVHEVLNRRRELTLNMIRRLHTGLGISAESLIQIGQHKAAQHYSCLLCRFLNPWATMIRRSWTRPASIEETLALWAASLREIKKRIRPLFNQDRVARNAGLFLESLLGDEQRKTGWMRAEAAGDPGPWRQQAILGRRDWDADGLRDIVRDYVIEHLADDDAVLVIDETGFLKQGKASCGVARQYTGSAGKITNCQIGVFAAYVSHHGHAFIDRALYLPKEW